MEVRTLINATEEETRMLEEKIPLHELNNALTVIAGVTHQLSMSLRNNPDDYVKDKLSTLSHAVSRAVTVTSRSRWDFGNVTKRAIDVAAQVREMSGVLYMIAGDNALRINADAECLAEADAVEVEGIILNLVKNAAEAINDAGTISVAVTKEKCNALCSVCGKAVRGRYVVCEVSDDGAGIRPENLFRIFEQQFTTKQHGQGLGLHMLQIKTHLMGGHVTVSCNPEGTTFRVYLPPAEHLNSSPKAYHGIPQGKKALVLAGNNGGAALLNEYLKDLDIQVIEPGYYQSADFILYDPDINAPETRGVISECAKTRKDIPIICITNYHVGVSVFGATHYLTKPFHKDRFTRVVRRVLS
jgi:hypothetical protein